MIEVSKRDRDHNLQWRHRTATAFVHVSTDIIVAALSTVRALGECSSTTCAYRLPLRQVHTGMPEKASKVWGSPPT